MLMKKKHVNKFLDRLHVGAVNVCIGLTVASTAYLAYAGYCYLTAKPMKEQENKSILAEGAHDRDSAKSLSS